MRITDDLLLPEATGPWGQIAKQTSRAFRRTTGKRFDGFWLEEAAMYVHGASHATDPIAWGFARKAVRRMQSTCPLCGSPAKRRPHHGRVGYRCAACHLPVAFKHELEAVILGNLEPSGDTRTVWLEHQLPELIRDAMPSHVWRKVALPRGGTLRYVLGQDVETVLPWLTQLAEALQAESHARITRIAQREGRVPDNAANQPTEGGDAGG